MSKKKVDFQSKLIALGSSNDTKSTRINKNVQASDSLSLTRAKATNSQQQQVLQQLDLSKMKEEIDRVMDSPQDKFNKTVMPYINQLKLCINKQQQVELANYFLVLTYILIKRPQYFIKQPQIIEFTVGLLKSFNKIDAKSPTNQQSIQFICTFLNRLYSLEDLNQIDAFLRAFVDDWLGDRLWCDLDSCRDFVLNLIACFKTKQIPFSLENINEESGNVNNLLSLVTLTDNQKTIINEAQVYFIETIKEISLKRITGDSKYLIKLLHLASGLSEVRLFALSKLDTWLNNVKLAVYAQDLLLAICINCSEHDNELIHNLVKLKPKPKQQQHYLDCLKEVMKLNEATFEIVLSQALLNEVTRSRDQHNSNQIQLAFSLNTKLAAKILAIYYQKLLSGRDDNLKLLRSVLRETIRNCKQDFELNVFTQELLTDIRRHTREFCDYDERIREKYVSSVTDIITVCLFISITPQVKDAYLKRNQETRGVLSKYYKQASLIQAQAVMWLQSCVKDYKINPTNRINSLLKVLFMADKVDTYYSIDDWPPDKDRAYMLRVVSEIPVALDTLMHVLIMNDCLTAKYILDLQERLIKTAAYIQNKDPNLFASFFDFTNTNDFYLQNLFKLTLYSYPSQYDSILPKNYTPPLLAVTALYWKAIQILAIVSVLDSKSFGQLVWRQYPTLRILMEILMTEDYSFPPQTSISLEMTAEKYRLIEFELMSREKAEILELESYFASTPTQRASLTEKDSLLIGQIMKYDPKGVARRPPNDVLQHLKKLNGDYKLGQYLCKCRNPDYLLELIKTQNSTLSLSWLAGLIESNNECLEIMPIECICEFVWNLLSGESEIQIKKSLPIDTLVNRIESVVFSNNQENIEQIHDVFTYFLNKLTSDKISIRQASLKIIQKIFLKTQDYNFKGVLDRIEKIHVYEAKIKKLLIDNLLRALFIETQPNVICDYLLFLLNQLNDHSRCSSDLSEFKARCTLISNFFLNRMQFVEKLVDKNHELLEHICKFTQVILTTNELHDTQLVFETLSEVHYKPNSRTNAYLLIKIDTNRIIYLHESLYFLLVYFSIKYNTSKVFLSNFEYLNCQSKLFKDTLSRRMIELLLLKSNENSSEIHNQLINELDPKELVEYITNLYGIPDIVLEKMLLRLAKESYKIDLRPSMVTIQTYLSDLGLANDPNYNFMFNNFEIVPKTLFDLTIDIEERLFNEVYNDFNKINAQILSKQTCYYDKMDSITCDLDSNDDLQNLLVKNKASKDLESLLIKYLAYENDDLSQLKSIISSENTNFTKNINDLLIDILVKHDDRFNFNLLFKLKQNTNSDAQSFLLSLFLNQSNWTRINEFKEEILFSNEINSINSKQALDFLHALINIPELWKCTDFKMRRESNTNEDTNKYCLFNLNEKQLEVLVDLIKDELSNLRKSDASSESIIFVFKKRFQILLHFLKKDDESKSKMAHLVEYLQIDSKHAISKLILYELYLNKPNMVKFNLNKPNDIFSNLIVNLNETSSLDIQIHHLLSTFQEIELSTRKNELSVAISKRQEALLIESSGVCMNIALNHPRIFIRFLPMLEGILQGKVIYTYDEFKRRRIDKIFTIVADLMIILIPIIFEKENLACLESILNHYVDVFRTYCLENHEFTNLVLTLIDFLDKFMSCNCKVALDLLGKNTQLICILQKSYPDIQSLRNISFLLTNSAKITSLDVSSMFIPRKLSSTRFWSAKQLEPFVNKLLNRDHSDGVIQVLRELDSVSQRQSLILTDFVYYLNDFLFDANDLIRDLAQTLLMRFLRLHSREAYSFLSMFSECLIHDNVKIYQSAMKIFAEFTLICAHKSQYLFKYALRGALKHNIDISKQLSDSLRLLHLDKHIYN